MPRNRHRFQTPPPADPIAAARDSSLVFRLNIGFFLRQLGVFLVMDLLLLALASLGLFAYAENRCADVAALVSQRGVPSEDALSWMEASDYTITPLADQKGYIGAPVLRVVDQPQSRQRQQKQVHYQENAQLPEEKARIQPEGQGGVPGGGNGVLRRRGLEFMVLSGHSGHLLRV